MKIMKRTSSKKAQSALAKLVAVTILLILLIVIITAFFSGSGFYKTLSSGLFTLFTDEENIIDELREEQTGKFTISAPAELSKVARDIYGDMTTVTTKNDCFYLIKKIPNIGEYNIEFLHDDNGLMLNLRNKDNKQLEIYPKLKKDRIKIQPCIAGSGDQKKAFDNYYEDGTKENPIYIMKKFMLKGDQKIHTGNLELVNGDTDEYSIKNKDKDFSSNLIYVTPNSDKCFVAKHENVKKIVESEHTKICEPSQLCKENGGYIDSCNDLSKKLCRSDGPVCKSLNCLYLNDKCVYKDEICKQKKCDAYTMNEKVCLENPCGFDSGCEWKFKLFKKTGRKFLWFDNWELSWRSTCQDNSCFADDGAHITKCGDYENQPYCEANKCRFEIGCSWVEGDGCEEKKLI